MPGGSLRPEDVAAATFSKELRGYATGEVDDFLRGIAGELDRRRRGFSAHRSGDQVRAHRFAVALRGYARGEVAAFLDRVAAQLDGAPAASMPPSGSGGQAAGLDPHGVPVGADRVPALPPDPATVRFTSTLRGYATDDVDGFLDRVAAELARLRASPDPFRVADVAAGSTPGLESSEVRAHRFAVALRGYARGEVDAYLAQVADALDGYRGPSRPGA